MPLTIYRVQPRLKRDGWHKLLCHWGDLMDRYCKAYRSDAPYCYGEIPLTGLLAAAAWTQTKGMSLVEVEAEVRPRQCTNKRQIDAWVVLRKVFYQVEAKQYGQAVQAVCKKLKEACRQLRNVPAEYQGDAGLALCYILHQPILRGDGKAGRGTERLCDLASHFDSRSYTLSAVYSPPGRQLRKFEWWWGGRRKRHGLPGLALVGRADWLPR